MAFLVKGDEVSLVRKRDGHVIFLPPEFVMVHDVHGELVRACDLFVVPYAFEGKGASGSDKSLHRYATEYYGSSTPLERGVVDVPLKGWQRVAESYAIRYRRMGKYKGLYEHKFAELPWLEKHRQRRAYRLPLPDGCVLNDRGIVWP